MQPGEQLGETGFMPTLVGSPLRKDEVMVRSCPLLSSGQKMDPTEVRGVELITSGEVHMQHTVVQTTDTACPTA